MTGSSPARATTLIKECLMDISVILPNVINIVMLSLLILGIRDAAVNSHKVAYYDELFKDPKYGTEKIRNLTFFGLFSCKNDT